MCVCWGVCVVGTHGGQRMELKAQVGYLTWVLRAELDSMQGQDSLLAAELSLQLWEVRFSTASLRNNGGYVGLSCGHLVLLTWFYSWFMSLETEHKPIYSNMCDL